MVSKKDGKERKVPKSPEDRKHLARVYHIPGTIHLVPHAEDPPPAPVFSYKIPARH